MRAPDRIIGENYLHRWHLVPRNRFLNVYLHKFLGSDDDRALHDHPWASVSICLGGLALEVYRDPNSAWWDEQHHDRFRVVRRFWPIFRRATHAHRIEVIDGPVWTIFITGPAVRQWGFWCPQGWRHWREFTTPDGDSIGPGCD